MTFCHLNLSTMTYLQHLYKDKFMVIKISNCACYLTLTALSLFFSQLQTPATYPWFSPDYIYQWLIPCFLLADLQTISDLFLFLLTFCNYQWLISGFLLTDCNYLWLIPGFILTEWFSTNDLSLFFPSLIITTSDLSLVFSLLTVTIRTIPGFLLAGHNYEWLIPGIHIHINLQFCRWN